MKTATFTIGISASGKSVWANESIENMNSVIIERDMIRLITIKERYPEFDPKFHNMWKFWKFNKENEQQVTDICNELRDLAIAKEKDIIFSNTNLNVQYLNRDIRYMESKGYKVVLKYFPITYDIAVLRDKDRQHSVGTSVIMKQWLDWLKLPSNETGIQRYSKDITKPKAIIVDIDGTVANRVNRSPFEWTKVIQDEPIPEVVDLVRRYVPTHKIIFLSGRDSVCRLDTQKWLERYFRKDAFELFMRPQNNFKKDYAIKNELFWNYIEPLYSIDFAIDDRNQIVRLWTDLGIKTIDVGKIYEDF